MHKQLVRGKKFIHLLKNDISLKIELIAHDRRTEAAIDHTFIIIDIQSITGCSD